MPPMGPRGRVQGKVSKPKDTKGTIKRLLSYLHGERLLIVISFICVIVSSLSNLAGSYMLKPIINNLINTAYSRSEHVALLARGLGMMALVYIIGVVMSYLQSRLMTGVSQRSLRRIRSDLFAKLQKLPVRYYDQHNTGDVMSRFTNDVDAISLMLDTTIIQVFSGVTSLVGTLALMFYTNVILTCVTLITAPLMFLAGATIMKKSRKAFVAQQEILGKMNAYIEETVTGQNVVKVFTHEKKVTEEFNSINKKLCATQIKAQFAGGVTGPVMNAMGQLNYTLTAFAGSLLVFLTRMQRGISLTNLDVGGLAVFVNFSRQFSRPINELSQQITNIMSALAGAERVFKVMDETPELNSEKRLVPENIKGDVVIENVTFAYVPGKTILKNVSIFAHPGQKIALVGSTGAGKTTITNLMTRFYDIDEGKITIDGIDIKDFDLDALRSDIAMVLQDTHLFTGTVRENIRYGRLDATDEEVISAAKTASAHSFIKHLPEGYDTIITGDGSNLSQGQRQLLNIARAALSRAPILVLDEATSSVDTRTERHINEGMDALMANRTTFVIAHRLSTVRNADAIMVLEHGEIIERGSHEELLEQKGRYYNLYTGRSELA